MPRDPKTNRLKERITGRTVPERARQDKALRGYLETFPRETIEQFCHASPDPRFQKLWMMMCNPAFRTHSLSTLARNLDITFKEFVDAFRDIQQMQGVARLMMHAPDVLEDTAIDAKSRMVACEKCHGTGEIADEVIQQSADGETTVHSTRVCPYCDGAKKVRRPGSKEARALVFEATGLTGKRGPLIAQQFNMGGGDTLESAVATTEKLLKAPVIDVERVN